MTLDKKCSSSHLETNSGKMMETETNISSSSSSGTSVSSSHRDSPLQSSLSTGEYNRTSVSSHRNSPVQSLSAKEYNRNSISSTFQCFSAGEYNGTCHRNSPLQSVSTGEYNSSCGYCQQRLCHKSLTGYQLQQQLIYNDNKYRYSSQLSVIGSDV